MVYKIGWFSTGRDEAARDLLKTVYDNIQNGNIKGEISFAPFPKLWLEFFGGESD
jgi:hypothetical protein